MKIENLHIDSSVGGVFWSWFPKLDFLELVFWEHMEMLLEQHFSKLL